MSFTCTKPLEIRPQGNGCYIWTTIKINKGDTVTFLKADNIPGDELYWVDTINGDEQENLLISIHTIQQNFKEE